MLLPKQKSTCTRIWLEETGYWKYRYEHRDPVISRPKGNLEGAYSLVWLDTVTGGVVASESHTAPGKHVDKPLEPTVVRVPAFRRDIALLVTRKTD